MQKARGHMLDLAAALTGHQDDSDPQDEGLALDLALANPDLLQGANPDPEPPPGDPPEPYRLDLNEFLSPADRMRLLIWQET